MGGGEWLLKSVLQQSTIYIPDAVFGENNGKLLFSVKTLQEVLALICRHLPKPKKKKTWNIGCVGKAPGVLGELLSS